ncbi:beta-phosphoglucomutase [Halobacteroides halobius DSM 5150]|uniref:Beta-phosphoglucomutase n=1 Tax=Halobacteroides halobius (strain ATCC 35273 / DSM 5150 / MD-1) TaxID=748449 RepID=L0KAC1_HALHC|nr:beta-phosphoglucomutase [Halobacteroides halobius]AGB41490.1 beta-phosphoglucomutase [Halobacteroides halobius DSM 5150]
MIKAIILDLDGVVTETSEYHFQGWKRLADEEGISFTREDNEQLRGVSRSKSLELLLGDHIDDYTKEEFQEMMDRKNGYYQEYLTEMGEDDLLSGARDLLNEIKERGLKMAIASASRNAKTVLEGLDITDEFDTISDGYSVENAKPAPDIFLHTAKKLGVKPEECVVLEDAESGVDAALAANMVAVGVGPKDRVGHGDYCFSSTADVDLNKIL